jgi:hypothetical protein
MIRVAQYPFRKNGKLLPVQKKKMPVDIEFSVHRSLQFFQRLNGKYCSEILPVLAF